MIRTICFLCLVFVQLNIAKAQSLPSPKDHFGFNIGDDYQLANYTQTEVYFKKLAESNRVQMVDMGLTEEGRHQWMIIVSSPENIKNLNRYKDIAQKLAHSEGLTDEQAHALASEGKAIVWIDGGLHATEVVGTHQLIESVWQFVSRSDAETMRILNDAIILFVHANPDGQELVSNWYMQEKDVKKRNTNIPRLYEKYIGHDNNRDFFMMNVKETQNISKQQYLEWFPQIIYNHHQSGPPGSVLSGPPYRDPFNYVYDPLLVTTLDAVGAEMQNRLNRENKPGYTSRSGSSYSTWWNGGLRTTGYFHNMIGLLTEIIGSPTPSKIPLVPTRLIPNLSTPNPVIPQEWHFRQSIDYSVSLNYAVLNYAVNQKEQLLYGIYKMGKNSIENGSTNHWTLSPKMIDSINSFYKKDQLTRSSIRTGANQTGEVRIGASDTIASKYFDSVLKDPKLRDARGYIIPSDQPDFATAVKFINALIRSGISVHKATADFAVNGKKYAAGSYIVKTAQAFRPHVLDMFEPQDHPNDFLYPGGPPVRPYDAAGWTLAYSMGVQFDRLLDDFNGPFERVPYGELQSVKTDIPKAGEGYVLNAQSNNSFIAVNELLKAGVEVFRITNSIADKPQIAKGAFFILSSSKVREVIEKTIASNGLNITSIDRKPSGMEKIVPARIALWDQYGGSMSSGWVRWLMEQYHFPFQVIYSKQIDAGDLRKKYDVLVFVSGAIPSLSRGEGGFGGGRQPKAEEVSAEYRERLGRISADTSIPQLKKFLEDGGSIVTIGSSTNLAYHLKLPVRNALVEMNTNNQERPLPSEKFYIPGSLLTVNIDSTQTAAYGMRSQADVYFDASPVFKLAPEAMISGAVKPIVWFATDKPLHSGWAWGQAYLKDGVAAFVASVGKGKLYAFGPEIAFRGQSHGTFKLLFNQLYQFK